jgi:hypothetical protein
VLQRSTAEQSILTEGFRRRITTLVQQLLEHESASEEKLVATGGKPKTNDDGNEQLTERWRRRCVVLSATWSLVVHVNTTDTLAAAAVPGSIAVRIRIHSEHGPQRTGFHPGLRTHLIRCDGLASVSGHRLSDSLAWMRSKSRPALVMVMVIMTFLSNNMLDSNRDRVGCGLWCSPEWYGGEWQQ